MIRKLLSLFLNPNEYFGARSTKWPQVRARHLVIEPVCQVCGGTLELSVHHIYPYHLFPELELSLGNLITLCEANKCHFIYGHCKDWKAYNPTVIDDCSKFRLMLSKRLYK